MSFNFPTLTVIMLQIINHYWKNKKTIILSLFEKENLIIKYILVKMFKKRSLNK